MVNILDLLKGQLGSAAIGKVAELIGDNSSNTSSAIESMLPALVGGLINKGNTEQGASGILDFLNEGNHDGSMFDNLSGLLGNGSKMSTLMSVGSAALPFILGGKKAGMLSLLSRVTGMGSSKSSSLMSILAPMVLGMIGKQVKGSGLNASGLMDMLMGQKEHVAKAAPAELSSLLGFAGNAKETVKETVSTSTREVKESGGSMMKWLLPLLAILAGAFFFMKSCGGDVAATADNAADAASETTTQVVEGAKDMAQTAVTYTEDAAGNLVDGSGNIIKKAGEFTKDASGKIMDKAGNAIESIETKSAELTTEAGEVTRTATNAAAEIALKMDGAGNLVNEAGEIVYKAGDFKTEGGYYVDKNGKRIGKVWAKIKKAVGDAAEKTAEFFTGTFGGMFSKKAGASSTHTLSQMKFDEKSNRITYYSKPEFEGLVAALKANKDANITVNVHTADGGDKAKKLSAARADQIELMLTTLGVGKKQVKSKGMGAEDAAKAAANAIEIVVN